MTLADLLADLRAACGLSQEQLAERSGVSVRAIGDIERGTTRRPQRETLRALIDGLGLDPARRSELERAARAAPPATTHPAPTRRLPAPVSSLIGRGEDVAALTRLVRDRTVRLVTVTGTGGVGKSRLAVEVGWRVAAAFTRVDAVDLSALQRSADVPQAMAAALGCRTAGLDPADAVAARIGDAKWLLVLDSFEHVAGAAGGLSDLLARCPRLTALVTSRGPLSLRGEHVWPLAPLAVPAATAELPQLRANPSVTLLIERTAAIRPGFALTEGNAAEVARLCARLDGLPLAIELAAAQLRVEEPAALLAHLAARKPAPGAAPVDLPDRHRTLRATVEWSTGRLAADDRVLLGVLAVFAGGAGLDAVRAVLAGAGLAAESLAASIASLAAGSLIGVADRDGTARVSMLDTIREVAADLLVTAGLEHAVRAAHARHFLALVRDPATFALADAERDNLRAALDWPMSGDPALLDTPLARGLTAYLFSRGQFVEARRVLSGVADAAPDDATRAWAWHGAAIAANESGDPAAARAIAERCAATFAALGDDAGRCTALTVVGNAEKSLGRYPEAAEAHRLSLELARSMDDPRRVTVALNNLGTLAHDRGDHDAARAHYAASLEIKREVGDDRGTALVLMNLGGVENDLGRHAAALDYLGRAVAGFEALGELGPTAFALALRAEAELGLGRDEPAAESAAEALRLAREVDYRPAIGLALARLGDQALARGDLEAAATLLTAALDDAGGGPEQARILDRLAVALPGRAAHFRSRADHIRSTYGLTTPPVDRERRSAVAVRQRE